MRDCRPAGLSGQPAVRGSPNEALLGATIGFFIGFGAVSLFGPTAHSFANVMHLSVEQVALLVAFPTLTGSLLRIPFGAWVDTTGGKLPFLILLIMSMIGIGGLYYMLRTLYPDHLGQSDYRWLLLFGALGGCGIAIFPVGVGQVSYWFPKSRQGLVLAAYAGFGNTSPGIAALIIPLVILFVGLGGAYLVWLTIVVVGIGLYLRLGHNAPYFQLSDGGIPHEDRRARAARAGQELFPRGNVVQTLIDAAVEWRTWLLVVLYFTTFGGFLALTAWFPTYWQGFFHANRWTAVILTASFSLLSSLIRVPGGEWADHFGGEVVAMLSLALLLVGALLMTLCGEFFACVIGALFVGAGMGVNNAAVFRMVPNYVPHAVGGAAGWVGGLGALGGFAVPPLLGYFVEMMGPTGYARGFAVYIGLSILGLLTIGILRSTPKEVGASQAVTMNGPGRLL